MYLDHFGLTELPFNITPDTSFFFASRSYQEALNTLLIAVSAGEGFIKITGEVGAGKTLLCRKLMASLGPEYKVAYLPNPYLEPRSLLMMLATELSISLPEGAGQHEVLNALNLGLLEFARQETRVVVCLDEVQAMPIETLEALRLLSNLETEKRKLLQVVIFGQPELEDKLSHPSIRQLRQRISFDYKLDRMGLNELHAYLMHRLFIAGYRGPRLFTGAALWWLHAYARGTPRLINILAHKSLLAAFGRGQHSVGMREVRAAAADTCAVGLRWRPLWLGSALALVLGIAGATLWMVQK
ncbi:AAA family ATPase [Pseudomethylobacillus aquaticus]|uniref:AAA family ATPase n=1 Tax=Pseudomethylobacillus aquaticus TaxID=2676064 RepID=A0A3N0V3R5_9PROT|nr:AAA family ATPase [Pseudomethylobacillus aquaticus]ROH87222.1 AAA family ATPase [Pseudomethylobacillus aquaticus]